MRPGSMVLKIYKHSDPGESSGFSGAYFLRRQLCRPLVEPVLRRLREWRNRCIIITSMRCPRYITSRRKMPSYESSRTLYTECENRGFLCGIPGAIEYRFTELYYASLYSPICREWRSRSCLCKRTTGGQNDIFRSSTGTNIIWNIPGRRNANSSPCRKERSAVLSLLQDPAVCMEATGLKGGHGA